MHRLFHLLVHSTIVSLISCSLLHAAPLETRSIEGKEPGPTVRIMVGRTERNKTLGLDKQLAGFSLTRGRLIIETHATGKPIEPGFSSEAAPDWQVMFLWSEKPAGMKFSKSGTPLSQLPRVASTSPVEVADWLKRATGNYFSSKALASHQIASLDNPSVRKIEFEYVEPRTGAIRSRQMRISRRFVANLLVSAGMMEPTTKPLPPGVDRSKILCLYDAEGTGFAGGLRLERIVDDTTLDFVVLPVCGEDIREGILDGTRGFIIPGGGAASIARALRPDGVKRVSKFVETGGAYIGVCAGAYFPTSGLSSYAAMSHLKSSSPWQKGSAHLKVELTPKGEELLGSEFKSFTTRYNNGPVFPDIGPPPPGAAQQAVVPLALFKEASVDRKNFKHEIMIDTPAILATEWGRGRLLTISPHPESHEELTAMVARCYGWALGIPKEQIQVTPKK